MPLIDLTGMTAVGYIRVSTEDQAGERQTSLADQRAAIAQLAAKLGVTLGHVFEDAGLSGATMQHRPAMRALIDSCKASPRRHFAFVLALNDSRWGRFPNPDEATYWRFELERVGWVVRFAEMDDIHDATIRPLLRMIGQTQATAYRTALKANVLRGARGQAEQGHWQAKAPFGYLRKVVYPPGRERVLDNCTPKATDEKLVLTPHPAEAPIVRQVFERYAKGGESLASLLEWASRAYPSKEWTRAAMLRLLTNPAYLGDVVWGRMLLEPGRRSQRSPNDWYGKRDAHEPIISRELFAAAQIRLGMNRRRTRGVRSDWILSGIVRCRCGRGMVGVGASGPNGKYPVYGCATRGAHASRRCAYPGAVIKALLEETTIGLLAKEVGSATHRRALAAAIDRALDAARTQTRTIDAIAADLDAVQQKRRRILSAIEHGAITPTDAADRMAELRRQDEQLSMERAAAARSQTDTTAWRDELVRQAADFRAMAAELKGPALRELLARWIERAEFNTTTRELTVEIRRVPAAAVAAPTRSFLSDLGGFDTEGDPSKTKPSKKGANRLDATITRKVIVGRRRTA